MRQNEDVFFFPDLFLCIYVYAFFVRMFIYKEEKSTRSIKMTASWHCSTQNMSAKLKLIITEMNNQTHSFLYRPVCPQGFSLLLLKRRAGAHRVTAAPVWVYLSHRTCAGSQWAPTRGCCQQHACLQNLNINQTLRRQCLCAAGPRRKKSLGVLPLARIWEHKERCPMNLSK